MSYRSKTKATDDGTAESIFLDMIGDIQGEATIKQFATAVEKLGYEWDAQMLRDVFDRIDHSGNGLIDFDEFKQGLTLVAASQIFREMDTSGDGLIQFEEFQKAVGQMKKGWSVTKVRDVFKKVDHDKSEALDLLEFLDAINEMHQTGSGGLMELGFEGKLKNKMNDIRRKIKDCEDRMRNVQGQMKGNEAAKKELQSGYDAAKQQRRGKEAEVEKLRVQLAPQKANIDDLISKMGPMGEQLEENMAAFAVKEGELEQVFNEKKWADIPPISDELVALQDTIKKLEGKLGITRSQHNALLAKYESLSGMHKASEAELNSMHNDVLDAEASLQAAIAAHADNLEEWKATSSEYKQLKKNLLLCQIKEKKAQIANCLGDLNTQMGKYRRAQKKLKALCEAFQIAEDEDDWETTGPIGDELATNQRILQEADAGRHRQAQELKRLRALLNEEKKGLSAIDEDAAANV